MAEIRNPRGAYGQTAVSSSTTDIEEYTNYSTTAIPVGAIVTLTHAATAVNASGSNIFTPAGSLVPGVASANTSPVVGVALNRAEAGDTVRVAVRGPARVPSSGSNLAAGTSFTSNASGQSVATASTLNHQTVGWTLEATGSVAGVLTWVYVQPAKK